MARVCEFCGKGTTTGRTIKRKGLPKCKGGIGLKTVGISKRKFKPNIQRVRVQIGNTVKRVKICTRCLRSDKVQKPSVKQSA